MAFIVDYDETTLEVMSRMLRGFGCATVVPFADRELFMQRADLDDRALVIINVHMPGRPLPEILRELKKRLAQPKVILMTGASESEVLEEAAGLGFPYVLPKPITREALQEAVQTVYP